MSARPVLLRALHLSALLALLVCSAIPGALTAQRCRCPSRPRPIRACAGESAALPFADVVAEAAALDGQTVTVRGVLHQVFGCAYRTGSDGCEPMCSGQVVILAEAGREDPILYLGEATPSGPFGCVGTSEDCACCRLDARDQPIEVTGVLRSAPTLRLESPRLCTPR